MQTGRIKSDKYVRSGSALPEAGRIKVGEKKKNAKGVEYPSSLDYFRATGSFAEMFHKIFGAKPTKLMVVFISDELQDSCNEHFSCWEGGKLWGTGDGESFRVWDPNKTKDGDYVDVGNDSELLKNKKWDVTLQLRFILPEMKGVLGQWIFVTKGAKTTIPTIVKAFDFIKERLGTVVGVPFELVVEKAKGYSPGEARQYSKVKLIPCFSESYMEKVREFLASGKPLSEVAPLMVTEAKMLAAENLPAEVPVAEVDVKEEVIPEQPTETKTEKSDGTLFGSGVEEKK